MADIEKNDNSNEDVPTNTGSNNSSNNNMEATATTSASSSTAGSMTNSKISSNNNWWGSWINSAKSKSVSVLEAVKRDLDEISTAVRTEVSHAGNVLGETLKLDEPESTASNVKKSLSSFFGQVSEALAPSPDDDDAEAVLITSDGAVTLTGFQKHLAELQTNEATYLSPPDSTLTDNYHRWLEIVEQDQFTQNQLAKHLTNSEILNEKYLSLVPEKLSHMEFWKRYLFKRALLEDALAHAEIADRRAKAEIRSTLTVSPKRADQIIQTEQPKAVLGECDDVEADTETGKAATEELIIEDTDIKWEAEDFGTEDISEEEQARLLEEYEAEIQEREKRKCLIVPLEEKLNPKEIDNKNQTAQSAPSKSGTKKEQQIGKKQQQNQQKTIATNKKQTNTAKSNNTTNKHVDNAKSTKNASTTSLSNQSTNSDSNNDNHNKNKNKNTSNDTKTSDTVDSDKSESLKLQKNHFDDETPAVKSLAEDLKTDAGSASDESWEKDFDLSDP